MNCACAAIRRAARLVTQFYSDEMRGTVDPPQFSLLTAIDVHPGIVQTRLGVAMGLDKTTLSRNLRLMKARGWIETESKRDGREKGYRLTASGKKAFASAKPGWLRAQRKLQAALKPEGWDALFESLKQLDGAYDQRNRA